MSDKKYSVEEIAELADALGISRKNDPASTTVAAPTLQGPFPGNTSQLGIFAGYGTRPERFSALVRPTTLAQLMVINSSVYHEEELEIMTGVTGASGTNATGFCGDPPTVGQGKVCKQRYGWGKYEVKTQLESLPEIGTLRSRSEVPGQILNAGPQGHPLIPDLVYQFPRDTRSQLQYELFLIGVAFERVIGQVLIQGDSTLSSANTHHGFIKEPKGIDSMIKTGYTDSETGIACPAADSAVLSFNAEVDSTIAAPDSRNIVHAVTDTVWGLKQRASAMGMADTVFAIAMRQELFRAIADVWACEYYTYRCSSSNAGQPFVNNADSTNALRLAMMEGQYLLIDGVQYPVVFEEGIPQDSLGGNKFKSDLYVLPISWAGIPLLHTEFFPMNNQYAQEFAAFQGEAPVFLNNGLWAVANRNTGFCKEYLLANKLRFILETPFLAGRVDDIRYTFRAPIRNSNPSDTWFYADGGITYRS